MRSISCAIISSDSLAGTPSKSGGSSSGVWYSAAVSSSITSATQEEARASAEARTGRPMVPPHLNLYMDWAISGRNEIGLCKTESMDQGQSTSTTSHCPKWRPLGVSISASPTWKAKCSESGEQPPSKNEVISSSPGRTTINPPALTRTT